MATAASEKDVLISERVAGGILPKVLNSFDMVAIFVAIVLFVSNAAVVSGAGGAAYIFWIVGFLTFLIPGAIVTGQLGLMFPGEGSIYVWTHKAFGKFWGFFAGFCAWWPGVLVMVATGAAVVTLITQLGSNHNQTWLSEPWEQGVVILLVIAFSMVLSWLRFRAAQNLVNVIFVAYGGAILLVGLAGLFWLINGNAPNGDFTATGWAPSSDKWTFYGLVILALLGIEVPLNMGVEIRNTRSITKYLFWGSIVVMAAYLFSTFGVQMTVPRAVQLSANPAAIGAAVQLGFGAAGTVLSDIVIVVFIGFFLFNTAVYNYSFGRLLFVSGLDQRLPAAMSKVNKNRVPWVAVLVQSIIAALVAAISYFLPYLFAGGADTATLSTRVYDVLQAAVTVIWCISMVILFVDVVIIRSKYQEQFNQTQLAPSWAFYLCSLIGLVASAVGIVVTFLNPWTTSIAESDWWEVLLVIALASLVVGAIVYFIGQATVARSSPPPAAVDTSGAAPAASD
ncbi:MAG TPA: amino acid permease [Ktedonobacterales bacterium]|nr:amino acid permease [Ktedonobacterales bacterium]